MASTIWRYIVWWVIIIERGVLSSSLVVKLRVALSLLTPLILLDSYSILYK